MPGNLWSGLHHRYLLRFHSRTLNNVEWNLDHDTSTREVKCVFYVARKILRIRIDGPLAATGSVESVQADTESGPVPVPFRVTERPVGNTRQADLHLLEVVPATRIVFRIAESDDIEWDFRVTATATDDVPPDLDLLTRAFSDKDLRRRKDALEAFHRYEEYSSANPAVSAALCELYEAEEDQDRAEAYALQTLVNKPSDEAQARYQKLLSKRPPPPAEEIRALQEEAQDWIVDPHEGILTLQRDQRFELALRGWHLKKCRELIEVRRRAAGRFLNSLHFQFSHNEFILHTGVNVIHADGQVEAVPQENFTVADSEAKNVYITVEDQKAGIWILPDLAPGDVVEWKYHLFCYDYSSEGDPEFFLLHSLFQGGCPTYRARMEFVVPADVPARLSWRNGTGEPSVEQAEDGSTRTFVFEGSRHVPVQNTNFPFDHFYLNPLVACSYPETTWAQVAETERKRNFGNPGEEAPPAVLAAMLEEAERPVEALERSFYWVRDKLRYASLRSGQEIIGEANRAETIVESGAGDCKDKTYLLSLVCRKAGIPHEFLVISTKRGILVEDLPANQFDHVFLRARPSAEAAGDDGWLYMDAANSLAPFGSPPAWCQGLQVLALNGSGDVIRVPTDPPEANRVVIRETIDSAPGGWLTGTFDFLATGHCGRLTNERMKAMSLSLHDPVTAAQGSLGYHIRNLVVGSVQLGSDTGSGNVFRLGGEHRRSRLLALEGTGKRIGRLSWGFPGFPGWYWKNFSTDRLFAVDFPARLELTVTVKGSLLGELEDFSRCRRMENDLCRIEESVNRTDGEITIHREVSWKRRLVEGSVLEHLDASMEAVEEACLLVLSFRQEPGSKADPD